jgi:hypothetical protein
MGRPTVLEEEAVRRGAALTGNVSSAATRAVAVEHGGDLRGRRRRRRAGAGRGGPRWRAADAYPWERRQWRATSNRGRQCGRLRTWRRGVGQWRRCGRLRTRSVGASARGGERSAMFRPSRSGRRPLRRGPRHGKEEGDRWDPAADNS